MATWLYEFNLGAGFVDKTSLVIQETLSRRMDVHKDLSPTTNEVNFQVGPDASFVNALMAGGADVPMKITKDGTRWFTGYVQRIPETSLKANLQNMSLKAYDPSILLKRKLTADYKKWGSTVSVVVGELITLAGVTSQNIGTISKTIDAAAFPAGSTTYFEAIEKMLSDFGYVLWFDETGTARSFLLYPSAAVSTKTYQTGEAGNILDELRVARKGNRYGGARVTFYRHEARSNLIVFSDPTDAGSLQKCNIDLTNYPYGYPGRAGSEAVYCEYAVVENQTKRELIATNSVTFDIQGTGITVAQQVDYGLRAAVKVTGSGMITRLDITAGSAILKGAMVIKESIISGISEDLEDYQAQYITADADADFLISGRRAYWANSGVSFSFKTDDTVALGAVVTIVDSTSLGYNLAALIVGWSEDDLGFKRVWCEALVPYAAQAVTTTGQAVQAPNQPIYLGLSYPSAQSLYSAHSFDGIPDITYPDNVAGTTYVQDAWATAGGFAGTSGGPALTVSGGELHVASLNNGFFQYTAWAATGAAKPFILRCNFGAVYTGFQVDFRVAGAWVSLQSLGTTVVGWGTYSAIAPAGCTGVRTSFSGTARAFDVDWVYIGDGSYTWTVGDDSGNGRTLSPHGALEAVTGRSGKGIRFKGGYLAGVLSDFSDKITLSRWVYFEPFSTTAKYLFSSLTTTILGGQLGLVVNQSSVPGRLRWFYTGDASARLSGYYQLPSAGLHHVIVSMDTGIGTSAALTMSIDGDPVALTIDATTALRPALQNNAYYVNAYDSSGTGACDGWIDESRIDGRLLGDPEKAALVFLPMPRATTDTTPPTIPTGMTVVQLSSGAFRIAFSASIDAESGVAIYRVYRRETSTTNESVIADVNAAGAGPFTVDDTSPTVGKYYQFAVSAVDGGGNESAKTSWSSSLISIISDAPATATGLSAAAVVGTVAIKWAAQTDAIAYRLEKSTDSGGTWLATGGWPLTVGANNYDEPITAGTDSSTLSAWRYRVKAISKDGVLSSSYSSVVSVTVASAWVYTPTAPTITGSIAKRTTSLVITKQANLADPDGWDIQISRDGTNWYAPNLSASSDSDNWQGGALNSELTVFDTMVSVGYLPIPLSGGLPLAVGQTYYLRARARGKASGAGVWSSSTGALVATPGLYADLAAAQIKASHLPEAVGGRNLLTNSDFSAEDPWTNWGEYYWGGSSGWSRGVDLSGWTINQDGGIESSVGFVWAPTATNGDIFGIYPPKKSSVEAGKTYEASARVGTHRVYARIVVEFYDATGGSVGNVTAYDSNTLLTSGGGDLSNYTHIGGFVTAPAGATQARFCLAGKWVTGIGSNYPCLFFTQLYFGRVLDPTQTVLSPWSPAFLGIIRAGMVAADTITANEIAAGAITAAKIGVTNLDVDGGANIIRLNAELVYSAATAQVSTAQGAILLGSGPSAGKYAYNYFDLTAGKFRVGDANNYVYYDGSGGLELRLTTFKVSSLATNVLGTLSVSSTGTVDTLTNVIALTSDATRGRVTHATRLVLNSPGAASTLYVGDDATGKTQLILSTSADASGYAALQAQKVAGTTVGDLVLQLSGGNVGIGLNNPAYKLEVSGTGKFTSDLHVGGKIVGAPEMSTETLSFTAGSGNVYCANMVIGEVKVVAWSSTATATISDRLCMPNQSGTYYYIGVQKNGTTKEIFFFQGSAVGTGVNILGGSGTAYSGWMYVIRKA